VLGIDSSEKMLAIAKSTTNDKAINYQCVSIQDVNIPSLSFNLIVSSLALHYIDNYFDVVKKVYNGLKKNGYFIFSVEHPICTAHATCEAIKDNEKIIWPITNYRDEKLFHQTWFVDNVAKYHRKLETYLNCLITAGFTIEKIAEPMPNDEQIAQRPDLGIHKIRPPLLMVSAKKI